MLYLLLTTNFQSISYYLEMKEIDFSMLKELANILKSSVYEVRIDTQVCMLKMSTFSQITNMY